MVGATRAYYGDPALRRWAMTRMRAHMRADELTQGAYWEDGQGCAVGCLVHTAQHPHQAMARQFGLPLALCHLEDRLFEGLAAPAARRFPLAFVAAIAPGVDLTLVVPRFLHWLLTSRHGGLEPTLTGARADAYAAVVACLTSACAGEIVAPEAWRSAQATARALAERTPWTAARAPLFAVGWAAETTVPDGAAMAALLAVDAAEARAPLTGDLGALRAHVYARQAAALLRLLKAAPRALGDEAA